MSLARPLGFIGGDRAAGRGRAHGARAPTSHRPRPPPRCAVSTGAYVSILGLTLTNPLTILLYGALVVSVGVPASTTGAASLWVGLGLGSAAWFLILVSAVAALRTRVSPRLLRCITIVSGVVIAGFGVLTVASAVAG